MVKVGRSTENRTALAHMYFYYVIFMKPDTYTKLHKIIADINDSDNVNLTRLTVLKKWFEKSTRQSDFALWLARRVTANSLGCFEGDAGTLFDDVFTLLGQSDEAPNNIVLFNQAAVDIYNRMKSFQNVFLRQQWGPVRQITNWNLMLVEKSLETYLWYSHLPTYGYKLAVDYCQNFDCRYGNGLNRSSIEKIHELAQFVWNVELSENTQ